MKRRFRRLLRRVLERNGARVVAAIAFRDEAGKLRERYIMSNSPVPIPNLVDALERLNKENCP